MRSLLTSSKQRLNAKRPAFRERERYLVEDGEEGKGEKAEVEERWRREEGKRKTKRK